MLLNICLGPVGLVVRGIAGSQFLPLRRPGPEPTASEGQLMQAGTTIFILSYVLIALGEGSPRKLDRPTAALVGAVLMLVTGALSQSEAAAAIDLRTLALLFGLMTLLAGLLQSRLPEALAFALLARIRGPYALLTAVVFGSGIAAAFMLNDTVCLLGTPLVLAVTARARVPATPYLLALATGANIGSVMTLTGNPQNILIGHASGWSWSQFALRMVPIGLLCLAADWVLLRVLYRGALITHGKEAVPSAPPRVVVDIGLSRKSAAAFATFLVAVALGAPMALSAVAAAAGLLVWANRPPRMLLEGVDWSLLLFFAGLFVIVAGLVKADEGVLNAWLARIGTHMTSATVAKLSLATAVGSNVVSNVPFVLIVGRWVAHTANPRFAWMLVSLTSTFAGNLTLLGSVANVIVAERASPTVALRFRDFLRVGLPVTATTTVIGVLALTVFWRLGWV
jgi:Na+/H+ antiporter NhaD/arsenite permease-like protein